MLDLTISDTIQEVYDEIISLPYYQDGEVYKYSTHLLVGEGADSKYLEFLEMDPNGITYSTNIPYKDYLKFFNTSIDKLNSIEIKSEEYEEWLFNQRESEAVEKYKDTVHEIHGELNRLCYKSMLDGFYPVEEDSENFDKVLSYGGYRGSSILLDLDKENDDDNNNSYYGKRVLNRNNPFADVSIEDQKFLFATDTDSFKVLELNTSHTLTRVEKDETKSYLALQPGFKIRVSSNLVSEQRSNIVFDDTLTTEIAQDDKVYIYLDGLKE